MITISMFNNKGGVGKTTLTCNLASLFAENLNKRVLVVDCDPQCNATQLIMGQDYTIDLYWNEINPDNISTISKILQPIEDGDSSIAENIVPIDKNKNRFNVDLIPGNPNFSIIEDRLGAAWHELLGGDIGGIRKTNWNSSLITKIKDNYDIIFFDLGPSLGSINRSVLIGCDYFITPMGTDIFSILGVKNISQWLNSWVALYENSLKLCEERSPGRLDIFSITRNLRIKKGYAGYTLQQYITKSKEGVRIPTKAYENIINGVPDEVESSLKKFSSDTINILELKLGDVPHLYSLIPLAQSVSSPILKLKGSDGLVGSQFKQLEDYRQILTSIANKIINNIPEL